MGNEVRCLTCERRCRIRLGGSGFCRTRKNIDGKLHTLVYGEVAPSFDGIQGNPIEKKPFYHFYPGSHALTAGSWSCNFACPWCQNWPLSKSASGSDRFMTPAAFVKETMAHGCQGTSISFNEPTLSLEWSLEVFRAAGLDGCVLKVNTIGCPKCRADFRETLCNLLGPQLEKMCPDCKSRFDRNVFRLLDCKREGCREITRKTPPMREHLDADCRAHFETALALLREAGQEYVVDDHLVRGFDYYTRTVYEIGNSILGARDAVAGGGRYDNLVAGIGDRELDVVHAGIQCARRGQHHCQPIHLRVTGAAHGNRPGGISAHRLLTKRLQIVTVVLV
jgi:pyruvate-formate lyase-activating enzyme